MNNLTPDTPVHARGKLWRLVLIEGIASQIRRNDRRGALPWWHLISEEERERYRSLARNHIDQVGWDEADLD